SRTSPTRSSMRREVSIPPGLPRLKSSGTPWRCGRKGRRRGRRRSAGSMRSRAMSAVRSPPWLTREAAAWAWSCAPNHEPGVFVADLSVKDVLRPLYGEGLGLRLLDQRLLPGREVWLTLEKPAEIAVAIRELAVRGAPAIGVAAAYGAAFSMR